MRKRTAQEIWEAALGEIQVQISRSNYRTWFAKTSGISCEDNSFIIGVPNAFVAEYLEQSQRSLIEKALINHTSPGIRAVFRVNGQHHSGSAAAFSPPRGASQLNSRYSFASFIEGENNRLARAAAIAVAQNPGRSYNPLFIHGGVGLGKTHLLHSIGHWALTNKLTPLCVSAEKFTNEYVTAVRERRMDSFHQKYRSAELLLIDDIQFISGKEQTEETFFHTFNELHNANCQIVLTSDRPPREIPRLAERLRSRFEWGLTVDIQPPDFDTRLAILQAKAREKEAEIPRDVLEYIAGQKQPNVRQLEGSLNRVIALSRLLRKSPDMELAEKAVAGMAEKKEKAETGIIRRIIAAAADAFQVPAAQLSGKKRDKETVTARRVAMYLMRRETGLPLAKIGEALGGRDAAAVTNACKKIDRDAGTNSFLSRKITEIQQIIHKE
jgi:chromosomal replication initiator protein